MFVLACSCVLAEKKTNQKLKWDESQLLEQIALTENKTNQLLT